MSKLEDRFLCFRLENEDYAAPLLEVKEVLGIPEITPIPQMPSYFLGIMNLRGQVISVVDLRLKFGLKANRLGETCIIIFEYPAFSVGVVVDEVKSVLSPQAGELCAPPDTQKSKKVDFVTGIINRGDQMILTIDVVKALDLKNEAIQNNLSRRAA
ncbi:MAG: chemotaxis protein CheW [Bdellovibrio sp.]|jgi:purine-binding chemotaxis protein CheW